MNDKFFKLPAEKRRRILNAAYKVFSENHYKKAPMSEIAEEADISKSLLFHYFTNKRELYLYLCKQAEELTKVSIAEYKVDAADNLFEMMNRNIRAKCRLMRSFPYICAFSLKAYYETEPDIKAAVQAIFTRAAGERAEAAMKKMEGSNIRPDIDVGLMYQEIKLACEGYLYEVYQTSKIDARQIEKDFQRLVEHWKKVYEVE